MPTPLSQSTINTYRTAKQDEINYLNSEEYQERLQRAGLNYQNSTEQIKELQKSVPIYGINHKDALNIMNSDKRGTPFSEPAGAITLHDDKIVNGITYPRGIAINTSYNNLPIRNYMNAFHEFGHIADKKLSPKAKAYNRKLTEGRLKQNTSDYNKRQGEIRNYAMGLLGLWRKYGGNRSFHDFIRLNKNTSGANYLYNTFKTESDLFKYMDNFVQNDVSPNNQDKPLYAYNGCKLIRKRRFVK